MLYNFLNPNSDADAAANTAYADSADISEYAVKAVSYLSDNSYVNGTDGNRFMPTAFLTRAEAAVMIYRLLTL